MECVTLNGKQQNTNDASGILDGVGNGFFNEPHSEVGEGHRDNIEQRNGQVTDNVDGIIVDILRQQRKDRVGTHDNADPNADLQMGVFFVGTSTFFVEQFGNTPKKGSANGKE